MKGCEFQTTQISLNPNTTNTNPSQQRRVPINTNQRKQKQHKSAYKKKPHRTTPKPAVEISKQHKSA
jgi:hypothetical protein